MSKLKILGVALALLGLLIAGGMGVVAETGSTTASWSMGSGCWITMTVPATADLGTASGEGVVLSNLANTIAINNNCKNGITLTVKPTAVSDPYDIETDGDLPNGASVFDDFKWKASNPSSHFTIATGKDSYTAFSGLEDEQTVGDSDNPAHLTVDIDYQYTTDVNDVPDAYSITLLYTATTK